MNNTELKYSLLSIASFIFSVYAIYKSMIVLAICFGIIGILFGIRSTHTSKPKWKKGILIVIIGIIIGYIIAALMIS